MTKRPFLENPAAWTRAARSRQTDGEYAASISRSPGRPGWVKIGEALAFAMFVFAIVLVLSA